MGIMPRATTLLTNDDEAAQAAAPASALSLLFSDNYSLITDVAEMALQRGLARPSAGNPAILEIPWSLLTTTGTEVEEVEAETDENDVFFRVGNILSLLPLSFGGKTLADSKLITMNVASYMAVHDFNNRHSPFWKVHKNNEEEERQINSQLQLLNECDLYLTTSFRDNELSAIVTGRRWMEEFMPTNTNTDNYNPAVAAAQIPSFSVLGTIRSATTSTAAILGAVTGHGDDTVGSSSSSSTATSYGIPNISPSATSAQLDSTGEYPFFGRTVPTNVGEAEAFCFFLNSIGVQHFAIFHVNDGYGTAYMASVVEVARSDKYNMHVTIASYRDYDEQSLQNAISQLKAGNVRFIFAIFSAGLWRESILALYNADLMNEDYEWFFAESLATAQGTVLDLDNPRDLDLAMAVNRTAGFSLRDYNDEVQILGDLMNAFAASDAAVNHYLASQRSGFLSLDQAQSLNLTHVGHENQASFRQFLQSSAFPNPSTYALFTYDAIWALGLATCQSHRNQTSGPEIFETFRNLQFMGASGNVTFDPTTGTRDSSDMNYQVVNLMAIPLQEKTNSSSSSSSSSSLIKITPVVSTIINLGKASLTVERPLVYADGSTVVPAALPSIEEDLNLVPNSVRAVCWSLAALVMLCSISFLIWTFQRRNLSRVRASQPIFLVVLCIGTFFIGASIIFLTLQEPVPTHVLDASCMVEVWLLFFGFSTTFAALFAKTWRIHTVYRHARSCRRVKIQAKDVLWPFAVVFTLNLTILTAWTVIDPLEWHRVPIETTQYGQVVSSRGTCMAFGNQQNDGETSTTTTSTEVVFFWCIIAVNGCAFLISTIESYRARDLPSEFNESFYVWVTNLIILESLFISIPVLYLVDEDPSAHMISQSLIATVFALAVLIPMFLPKMSRVRTNGSRNEHRQVVSGYSHTCNRTSREGSSRTGSAMQRFLKYPADVLTGARSCT